jgi:hypothetical protein
MIDGEPCSKPATEIGNLPLCPEHRALHYTRTSGLTARKFVDYFAACPTAPHSPGWTYIVQLPNGRLKIGCTARGNPGLVDRLQDLHRQYGARVVPLAVIQGGFTLEQVTHHRFRDLRVAGELGEQFEPDDELLSFALQNGIHPMAVEAVKRYAAYRPKSEVLVTMNRAA